MIRALKQAIENGFNIEDPLASEHLDDIRAVWPRALRGPSAAGKGLIWRKTDGGSWVGYAKGGTEPVVLVDKPPRRFGAAVWRCGEVNGHARTINAARRAGEAYWRAQEDLR